MSDIAPSQKVSQQIEPVDLEPLLRQPPSPTLRTKGPFGDLGIKSAFVTGTTLSGKKSNDEKTKLEEVYVTHDRLNGLVDTLDDKVRVLLNENQANFLNVYKENMMHVQKELKALKKKIDEETYKRKNDERMNILEQERDWFRAEAMRLDQICKEQQRQLQELKFKTKLLNEDKAYYEEFAFVTKKENKALKEGLSQLDIEKRIDDGSFKEYFFGKNLTAAHKKTNTLESTKNFTPRKANYRSTDKLNHQSGSGFDLAIRDSVNSNLGIPASANEEKLQEIIRQVKSELDKEKKQCRQLRNEKSQMLVQRMELEEILVDSINEVKKDISRRRTSKNYKDYEKGHLNMQPIDISKISAADKRNIIEYFLSNDRVLEEVYNLVFGSSTQGRPVHTTPDGERPINMTLYSTKSDKKAKYTFSYGFTNTNSVNVSQKEISNVAVSVKAKAIMGELRRPDVKRIDFAGKKDL